MGMGVIETDEFLSYVHHNHGRSILYTALDTRNAVIAYPYRYSCQASYKNPLEILPTLVTPIYAYILS
jgi:hypothetical protein